MSILQDMHWKSMNGNSAWHALTICESSQNMLFNHNIQILQSCDLTANCNAEKEMFTKKRAASAHVCSPGYTLLKAVMQQASNNTKQKHVHTPFVTRTSTK